MKKITLIAAMVLVMIVGFTYQPVHADTGVKVLKGTDREVTSDYIGTYGIPASYMDLTNNGGSEGNNVLKNAFDRNDSTYWKSEIYNTREVEGQPLLNEISATFKEAVNLDRVMYASANEADGKGYPVTLKIHLYSGEQEIRNYSFTSTPTTSEVLFSFGETVECTGITLEWAQVYESHYWNATAREIVFLQPETEAANLFADIRNIFPDFAKTTVSEVCDTQGEIDQLREEAKLNINYESSMKDVLDRAEAIVKGEITWDKARQMSVKPEKNEAAIRQEGDIKSYINSTLDMGWYGSNKQVTGISAQSGTTLKVYVDAKAGDPIPKLCFTQFCGHWSGWQQTVSLKAGENTITVPSFNESKLTWPSQQKSGGPIYLINPYTPEQQSDQVKVYFEGGTTHPVFRKGDNVAQFKETLADYNANRDQGTTYDLMELESDYTQMTVFASHGDKIYNTNGKNPQKNLVTWDKYMRSLLAFDGVQFEKDDPYYNEMNEHLRLNFRLNQPYGAAFGASEQVGIFYDGWVDATIYTEGVLGWGFAHEVGHTMDNWSCTIGESTNNMISKYDESTVSGDGTRGNFATDVETLTSDRVLASKLANNPDYSYFETNRLNFLVWWHIESLHPGTWGDVKNMYRYSDVNVKGMNGTERQIYYFCLSTGEDLGPYFERFGYRLGTDNPVFKVESASQAYKDAIAKAKEEKKITDAKSTKYWYLDSKEYKYVTKGGETKLYTGKEAPEIKSVNRVSAGYSLVMPKTSEAAHLGYEILEGSEEKGYEVIGFTYGRNYTDKTEYEDGYVPSYKVRAIDRGLNESGLSEAESVKDAAVCSIGEKEFNSLKEAVEAAEAGDTIVLLADCTASGITVTKNLTIRAEKDVTITRTTEGNMITVTSGVLNIEGGGHLAFDGDELNQNGALLALNGNAQTVINVKGTAFANNENTGNGGAICSPSGRLNITDCTFRNNSAASGGAIANGSGCEVKIYSTTFKGNRASSSGGAIWNINGGIIRTFEGTVIEDNTAVNGGGIFTNGFTPVNKTEIKNNTASSYGGGIYYEGGNPARALEVTESVLENNKAGKGGNAIYVNLNDARVTIKDSQLKGDTVASVNINQANAVTIEGTDVSRLEVPATEDIDVCTTSKGIKVNAGGLVINVNGGSEGQTYPAIAAGKDEVITSETVEKAAKTGGDTPVSLTNCTGTHVVNKTKAVKETCYSGGNEKYYTCLICGKHFSDGDCTDEIDEGSWVIYPHAHSCEKVDKVDSTCTEEGCEAHYRCTECGENFSDASGENKVNKDALIIEMKEHSMVHQNTAGYLHDGYEYDCCSECGEIANKVAAAGYSKSYVKGMKVTKGKKSFTVKWKKQKKSTLKKFKGYQVRYSKAKNMAKAKYATASAKSKSKTIKKLSARTVYYVQVRTWTVSGGKTFYSGWTARTVKTK